MFGSILSWQCCISLNIDTKSPSVKLKIFVSSHYKAEFDLFKKPPTQTQEPYTPMFVNKALLVFNSGLCWRAPNPSFNPHKAPKERGKKIWPKCISSASSCWRLWPVLWLHRRLPSTTLLEEASAGAPLGTSPSTKIGLSPGPSALATNLVSPPALLSSLVFNNKFNYQLPKKFRR